MAARLFEGNISRQIGCKLPVEGIPSATGGGLNTEKTFSTSRRPDLARASMAAEQTTQTPEDRERQAWIASSQFMRGEITDDQLAEVEEAYKQQTKEDVMAIAEKKVSNT